MFRQPTLPSWNCSLFPQNIIPNNHQFRSPQRCNPHKENKSKKSLKYHSSSRNKNIQKGIVGINARKEILAIKENSNNPAQGNTYPQTKTQIARHTDSTNNHIHPQNPFMNHHNPSKQKQPYKNRTFNQPLKQSNGSLHNQMSTRAASPLNPYDLNNPKRVTFNYHNQYDFRPTSTKVSATGSPPPPTQKQSYHSSQITTTTTTMVGSYMPNNSELRKKYLQQKSHWSKQSITQHQPPNQRSNIQAYHLLLSPSPQTQKIDHSSRPRTSANIFGLSRLTQMMNEKQQTQSIYEGQSKGHEEGGVQFSRVLISCRKLMQDKNGILQHSAQTKLFDYDYELSKGIHQKKSNLFDGINLRNK